jgi:hypothetical protein
MIIMWGAERKVQQPSSACKPFWVRLCEWVFSAPRVSLRVSRSSAFDVLQYWTELTPKVQTSRALDSVLAFLVPRRANGAVGSSPLFLLIPPVNGVVARVSRVDSTSLFRVEAVCDI